MSVYTIRATTAADIPAITHLANQYIISNLSAEERHAGFLTGRFEIPFMEKMVASATSIVALDQQEIIGFVINSDLPPKNYPPLLQTMVLNFPEIIYRNLPLTAYNFFFYGPVLVNKAYRGNGLLSRMFQRTKAVLQNSFDLGIAFIHEYNHPSLKIHTSHLGMDIVGTFSFADDNYYILAFLLAEDIKPHTEGLVDIH